MNSPSLTANEVKATAETNVRIAVVLFLPLDGSSIDPLYAAKFRELGMDNAMPLLLLGQLLEHFLKREGVPIDQLSAEGTACDGSIEFETPHHFRDSALRHVIEFCGACCWMEIAATVGWFCEGELTWRIVRRGSFQIDLDRYFQADTRQVHRLARERTVSLLKILESISPIRLPDQQ